MSTKLSPVLVADYNTSLTTKISVGGTTATLLSNIDDDDNTMPDGLVYLTLDGDNSSKEHISATKTGANLTAIKSVSRQGVESAGVAREHRVGSTAVLTNFAHIKFLNDLLDGTTDLDGSTPLKYDADPTLVNDADIATKKYIDDIAIAGCFKATESLEGIAKLSVAAASPTAPLAVGDNDPRVPTQDENNALTGGQNTPSTAKPYVNNDIVVSHTPNTVGNLVGGSSAQSAFASWAAITDGSFRITVDGTAYNIDAIDFSGDGSMNDVAATLQVALRAATGSTETVAWSVDHFVITSVQSDENSEISVTTTSTGTVGTDISGLGANDWMDCDTGNGVATQGTSDHDSLVKLDTVGKIESELIEKDTDGTLSSDSDDKIATQKAVKTYADGLAERKTIGFTNNYYTYQIPFVLATSGNWVSGNMADWLKGTAYTLISVVGYLNTKLLGTVYNLAYRFNEAKKTIVTIPVSYDETTGAANDSLVFGLDTNGAGNTDAIAGTSTSQLIFFYDQEDGKLYAKSCNAVNEEHTEIAGWSQTNSRTLNIFRIEFDGNAGEARYYINDVLKATHSTYTPNAATDVYLKYSQETNGTFKLGIPTISIET